MFSVYARKNRSDEIAMDPGRLGAVVLAFDKANSRRTTAEAKKIGGDVDPRRTRSSLL
jgi:hypothetical protein